MGCELYRILEGLRAGGPEVVKVSYGASCGPYRLLEDLKAGDPENVKWRMWGWMRALLNTRGIETWVTRGCQAELWSQLRAL